MRGEEVRGDGISKIEREREKRANESEAKETKGRGVNY